MNNSITLDQTRQVVTVKALAEAKELPLDFLLSLGLEDTPQGVVIPYFNVDGTRHPRARIRSALKAGNGSRWTPGDDPIIPYGLDHLPDAIQQGFLILVEGESDCWTLWCAGFPALGIPGASMAKVLEAAHLKDIPSVYVCREPDQGGKTFVDGTTKRLMEIQYRGEIFIFSCGSFKDPSELYINDPENFSQRFEEILAIAEPWEPTDAPDDEDEDITPIPDPWPAPLEEAAFHGLAGEFVRLVNPHSESDPAADLIQFLVCFGNAIGRGPHWTVSATDHYLNLFVNLVGQTARGRKGTSLDVVLKVFGQVDEVWRRDCISGGLSSGEGLKYAVRDPDLKNGEIVDSGVVDKRLLVLESEFANVLRVLNREGNTLSPTIRQAWDTGTIRNLTKHDSITATGAHVSIIGHITRDELIQRMTETEASNGFANRFLWFAVRRSKHLPRGGSLTESELNPIVIRLHHALEHARGIGEMGMTEAAWTIWEGIYEALTRDIPGLFGMVTARAEAQVRRLACIYALLDQSDIVDAPHLKAALAVWRYAEDSAKHIFGDATGNPVADTIMAHLRQSPDGLTRTQIREEIFQRNKTSEEIAVALKLLEAAGMARMEKIQTSKRPRETWYAVRH